MLLVGGECTNFGIEWSILIYSVNIGGNLKVAEDLYLDATQAALALGVSVPTLYAYVSRKLVRSERVDGSRSHRYWKADIDRLAGKQPPASFNATQALLIAESRITLITDAGLYFRGRDAIELSQHMSLEALTALLWQTDEETTFGAPPADASKVWASLRPSLADLSAPERVIAMFPMIERATPRAYDLSPAGYARTGADVLRWYATILVKAAKPSMQPLHQFVAKALKAPPGFDDVIRRLLVLAADHEFDSITYAVRAVANVGVTAYQAVTTGLIASQGQRFQAERYGAAMHFLEEILRGKDGYAAVARRLRSGESLPGFGGSADRADPRTEAIMQPLERLLRGDREFRRLQEAARAAMEMSSASMEFIVPALFIGHRLGLRGDELGLSALGRIVGWVAHAMEQFHGHELVRPRATYVGLLPGEARSG
jgi:citrate synthase